MNVAEVCFCSIFCENVVNLTMVVLSSKYCDILKGCFCNI
jgi:hypothetical protein